MAAPAKATMAKLNPIPKVKPKMKDATISPKAINIPQIRNPRRKEKSFPVMNAMAVKPANPAIVLEKTGAGEAARVTVRFGDPMWLRRRDDLSKGALQAFADAVTGAIKGQAAEEGMVPAWNGGAV